MINKSLFVKCSAKNFEKKNPQKSGNLIFVFFYKIETINTLTICRRLELLQRLLLVGTHLMSVHNGRPALQNFEQRGGRPPNRAARLIIRISGQQSSQLIHEYFRKVKPFCSGLCSCIIRYIMDGLLH